MTREEIEKYAAILGRPAGDVALAALAINADGIRDQVEGSVHWERWDMTSPINGVDADILLGARADLARAEAVYLIVDGGQAVRIQPSVPHEGTPLTAATVDDVAEHDRADYVEELIRGQIIGALTQVLTG